MVLALWILPLCLACTSCITIPEHHYLHDALYHFEVLHTRHVSHHTPPHITPSHSHTRETTHLHFRTLERDFNLILTPSRDTLHNSIHISIVTDGRKERRRFPFPHFYTGHLLGIENTWVFAHLHPTTGVLTAAIHTEDDVYYVEPSFRHFHESHDFHMITYKHSHLKFNLTGQSSQHFCGNHDHNQESLQQPVSPWQHTSTKVTDAYFTKHPMRKTLSDNAEKVRLRRKIAGDVCTLHLVATPSFHKQYSSGDPDTTTLFLLNLLSDIDRGIFQDTNFVGVPKLGLVVTNITIYTDTENTPPYAREGERNSERLLKLFSVADWTDVCLAHLFTAVDFRDNRLGVAYIAGRNRDDTGGICSPLVSGDGGSETANVGVSSFRNSGNRLLLLAEARLVTAHEIGHGWGSEHDPTTGFRACDPPVGRNQGKYLMFPSATDGDQRNNDAFSPCSVAMISDVVKSKGTCFQERSQLVGLCGNYQVEEGEECDAGALGMVGADLCCTKDCALREVTSLGDKVECSDVNDACCENCLVSRPDSNRVCLMHSTGNARCLRSVQCMGEKTCPQNLTFDLRYVDIWSECGQEGRCLPPDAKCTSSGNCTGEDSGLLQCYNFCQWHGLKECFCTGSDECRFCCLQTIPGAGNATCMPFMDSLRPDRSSCVGGFCENGQCHPASQDLIQRLFELFDNPNLNTFVQFMRENIVGSVVILTALLWFPAGFLVHIFDVYRWREHKRVAREYEAALQDAEIEDEEDLNLYDDVFEEMRQTRPGVLTPEAKLGLIRMDSGGVDCFGDDLTTPLSPHLLATSAVGPYSGLWDNRLSTITEETTVLNPEKDNILAHVMSKSSPENEGFLNVSSYDGGVGTLV